MPKCFKCNKEVVLSLHPFSKEKGKIFVNASCHSESHLFEVRLEDVVKVGFKLEDLWIQGVIQDIPFQTASLFTFQSEDEIKNIIF